MRLFWIFFLFSIALFGEVNSSDINQSTQGLEIKTQEVNISNVGKTLNLGDLGSLGEFISPIFSGAFDILGRNFDILNLTISIAIAIFTLVIAGISVYFQYKIQGLSKLSHNIDHTLKEDFKSLRSEVLQEIQEEVKQQIIFTADKAINSVGEHAYIRMEYNTEQLKTNMQNNLFEYQKIIFKINQVKKYENEKIINDQSIDLDIKLRKLINIQGTFNEISNHDFPNLFSSDMDKIISTAIKLSEYSNIKKIVAEVLILRLMKNDSFAHQMRIKEVLHKRYNWQEPTDKEINTPPKN